MSEIENNFDPDSAEYLKLRLELADGVIDMAMASIAVLVQAHQGPPPPHVEVINETMDAIIEWQDSRGRKG